MAIKFEKITAGMRLLDIHKQRMGATKMSHWCLWYVDIISVDPKTRTAQARWNHNPVQTWNERRLTRLHTKPTKAYVAQQEARSRR